MLCVCFGNRIFAKTAVFVIFGGGDFVGLVRFGKEFGIKTGLKNEAEVLLNEVFWFEKDF